MTTALSLPAPRDDGLAETAERPVDRQPYEGGSTSPAGVTLGVTSETRTDRMLTYQVVAIVIRERPARQIGIPNGIQRHPTESQARVSAGFFVLNRP
jgi:hypothetical protein